MTSSIYIGTIHYDKFYIFWFGVVSDDTRHEIRNCARILPPPITSFLSPTSLSLFVSVLGRIILILVQREVTSKFSLGSGFSKFPLAERPGSVSLTWSRGPSGCTLVGFSPMETGRYLC